MRACAKFVAACIVGALMPQGPVLAAELIILTNQGATPTVSKEPDAARAMIRFMISPEAAPLLRKTHAEPAKP